ncbi:MAG: threonylcarbamoyl-AMP synthase [Candidatus Dadabacteria bacterium]|nr:MAG: threonylcarbamoyl-AMP synthase [Candidatus Dadabacteria bacterium]
MILKPTSRNISKAAQEIRSGNVVSFPTETVYGLGADAANEEAVKKIFHIKKRPSYNPLIVHLPDPSHIGRYADISDKMTKRRLMELSSFWPGPLSVVLKLKGGISKAATGGLNTVAIRIPSHPIALALLEECRCPVAAPSANIFSYVSPTTAEHVYESFGSQVGIILDGGDAEIGLESTVLSLVTDPPKILRPGYITAEQICEKLGLEIQLPSETEPKRPESPGMLKKHYAPHTPIVLKTSLPPAASVSNAGYIAFRADPKLDLQQFRTVSLLSPTGELEEVASKLYKALREQDSMGLDFIVVDTCEESDLGTAIMDRLRRAAK